MSLVMGLDQHRAQISAEWIDTVTAEVFRARIAPADRAGVRKFLKRFAGEDLEVALEATTGWRFVAEELERAGAEVHLAEPTETSGLKSMTPRSLTPSGLSPAARITATISSIVGGSGGYRRPLLPGRGVFSTRSADRPNPIGLHRVEVLAIDADRIRVSDLEALNGTPIIDVKPVLSCLDR